jgi:hypothetical protein
MLNYSVKIVVIAADVIGGDDDDLLTGGEEANRFVCGGGEDTITDYNELKEILKLQIVRISSGQWWEVLTSIFLRLYQKYIVFRL